MRKLRDVSGDDAADFEFFVGLEEQFCVAGENAGLHAIRRVVDLAQGLVEIFVGLDGHDRAENFLAVHFHVGLGAGENCRLDDQSFASATAEQARSRADGIFDPRRGADGVAFADERADVGGFVERIASLQFLHAFATNRSVNFP